MKKIRFTITGEYEANPVNYVGGAEDPTSLTLAEMVRRDREGWEDGHFGVDDMLEWPEEDDLIVTFEEVE